MRIFDAHLDLAMNILRGRDITKPAREQPVVENEIATVGLPDLVHGQVAGICATIFCEPSIDGKPGYRNQHEAYAQALEQLDHYDELELSGALNSDGAPSAIRLLEGADCVRCAEDMEILRDLGVQIVGLAWKRTRYAGGTGSAGPLTPDGRKMVKQIDKLHMIHDASHLAEQSFWDLIQLAERPIIASHSNCRAIVGHDPGERHLSDDMISAIIKRHGMVGINFYDRFLLPHTEYGQRRATLADVVAHIRHVCDLAGNARHVGLGTDMDGGLGREQIPKEIESSADLPRLAEAMRAGGFNDEDIRAVLHDNWFDFFTEHLG